MRGDDDRRPDGLAAADSSEPSEPERLPPPDAETDPSGDARTNPSRPALGDDSSSQSYEVQIDTASLPNPAPEDDDEPPTQIAEPGMPPRGVLRRKTISSRGPARDTRVGQLLAGRYRVERLIAKGGMGRVYLATQLPLERSVAVKVLNADFRETDPQFVKRFCLEASISARLSHPNVITIHDYGEAESGELFMAMEYLDGRPLSRCISRDGPFPPERTLHVAHQICRALREAHSRGVIHRDLKPGNVMLVASSEDPDFVKVLDFGLVKLFEDETTKAQRELAHDQNLTRAGTLLGSPRYMSPEQIRGDDLDPRTDVYSLGVILFQLVVGKPPFSGKTSVDVIYKHMNHKVPSLHGPGSAECPPALEAIIQRCLEKDRDKRYASMSEVIDALKDAQRIITGYSAGTDSIPVGPARGWSVVPSDGMALDNTPSISQSSAPSLGSELPRGVTGRIYEDPASGVHPAVPTVGLESPLHRPPSIGERAASMVSGPKRARATALALLLGVLAAGLAGWLIMRTRTQPPTPPPAAPAVAPPAPVPTTSRLSFTSEPSGAEVRLGGEKMGRTPFETELPLEAGATRRFEFVLEGYANTTVVAAPSRPNVSVRATLEALPKPQAAPTPEPQRPRSAPVKRRRPPKRKKDTQKPPPDDTKTPQYYRDNPY